MLEYFAEFGGWSFVLTTLFTGLFVVFLALALLIGFVYLFGLIFGQKKNKPTAVKPEAGTKQPAQSAMTVEDGVSDEVVAVIAAAVAAMSADGKSYVVRSVKRANKSGRPAWATAGIVENTRAF